MSVVQIVAYFNTWPVWLVWVIQLLFCYGSVLVLLRLFGKAGVFVFMGVMIIAANIQVIKLVHYPFFHSPVPLGTALFSAAYLASDILAEYFGPKAARKGILLGLAAFLLMVITMLFAMSFTPLTTSQLTHAGAPQALHAQRAMLTLFSPAPALLLASMLSYLISQFSDVSIFMLVKKITGTRWLWLRNNVSTWLAALLDNIVFSILAWRIFSSAPVAWHTLIVSYIFGTYLLRVIVAVLDTPFIYLAKFAVPRHTAVASRTGPGGRQ